MRCKIYNSRGDRLIAEVEAKPVCGVHFCDDCGDCLACYAFEGDCACQWVIYEGVTPEAEIPEAAREAMRVQNVDQS